MNSGDWLKCGGLICSRCGQETVRLVPYDRFGQWQVCPSCRPEGEPLFCVYPVEQDGASRFCGRPALLCSCCLLPLCPEHRHARTEHTQATRPELRLGHPLAPLSCVGTSSSSGRDTP